MGGDCEKAGHQVFQVTDWETSNSNIQISSTRPKVPPRSRIRPQVGVVEIGTVPKGTDCLNCKGGGSVDCPLKSIPFVRPKPSLVGDVL